MFIDFLNFSFHFLEMDILHVSILNEGKRLKMKSKGKNQIQVYKYKKDYNFIFLSYFLEFQHLMKPLLKS
jgi:hypothetical protein